MTWGFGVLEGKGVGGVGTIKGSCSLQLLVLVFMQTVHFSLASLENTGQL